MKTSSQRPKLFIDERVPVKECLDVIYDFTCFGPVVFTASTATGILAIELIERMWNQFFRLLSNDRYLKQCLEQR